MQAKNIVFEFKCKLKHFWCPPLFIHLSKFPRRALGIYANNALSLSMRCRI